MKYATDFNALLTSQAAIPCSVYNVTYEEVAQPSLSAAERAIRQLSDKIIAYAELVTRLSDLGNELRDDGVFAERPRLEVAFTDLQDKVQSNSDSLQRRRAPSIGQYKEDVYYKTWWDALRVMTEDHLADGKTVTDTDFMPNTPGEQAIQQAGRELHQATNSWLDKVREVSDSLDKDIVYLRQRITKYQKADTNIYER